MAADDQAYVKLQDGAGAASKPLAADGEHRLWGQLWASCSKMQWLQIFAIAVCILANKAVVLLTPLAWRLAVDAISASGGDRGDATGSAAARWVAMYCVLAVVADALVQLRAAIWGRLSNHLTKQVSILLFAHLHALSLRWHLNRKTGEVLRIIDIGVKAVTSMISIIGFSIGPTLLELALVSGIFLRIGVPAISLCVMGAAGLYVVYTLLVTRLRTKQRQAVNTASKDMQDRAVDSLLNFETVKLFAAEEAEARGYGDVADQYARAQVRSQDSLSALNWGQTVSMQLGVVAALLIAAFRASDGEQTVGEFVMIQMYVAQIFRPLTSLGSNYSSVMQAMADLERMTSLLALEPEIRERPGAGDLREVLARVPREERVVEFDNVSFFYQPGKPGGVRNLNFRVRGGGSVALVGPSGSGKSTSTRLLCRLLEIAGGSIRVCGTDIRDVTQQSLRSSISVVSQDTVLFNSTIRFNLTYGKPGASQEAIDRAAEVAQVAGFLGRMEEGYETKVGERGLRLSGGEKQRLGIARALLTDPAVLVLDEATSALDTTTEREVQSAIDAASAGRCTLAIAHRLSTIAAASEILVLRAGEVVERGTHRELLAAGGLFKEMWTAQAGVDSQQPTAAQCKAAVELCCPCSPDACPGKKCSK